MKEKLAYNRSSAEAEKAELDRELDEVASDIILEAMDDDLSEVLND